MATLSLRNVDSDSLCLVAQIAIEALCGGGGRGFWVSSQTAIDLGYILKYYFINWIGMSWSETDAPLVFDCQRLSQFELAPEQASTLLRSFIGSLAPDGERMVLSWQRWLEVCAQVNEIQVFKALEDSFGLNRTWALSDDWGTPLLIDAPFTQAAMKEVLEAVHHFKGLVGLFASSALLEEVRKWEASLLGLKESKAVVVKEIKDLSLQLRELERLTHHLSCQALAHLEHHYAEFKGNL